MFYTLKQMLTVLAIGAVIFWFAKPIAIRYTTNDNYNLRRNVWFTLTIIGFLSSNFFICAFIVGPIILWAARKDTNPICLYLILMQALPSVPVNIPMPGINGLIELNYARLLSMCVLVPIIIQIGRSKSKKLHRSHPFGTMDYLLIGFGILQTVLYIVPDAPNHMIVQDSWTNLLRRGFLFYLDIFVLYYAVSRSCANQNSLKEAIAAFCTSTIVIASIGIVESMRHWLLYVDVGARWRYELFSTIYSMRGGILRAQAASGHPLAFGLLITIGFGLWMYLRRSVSNWWYRNVAQCILILALLLTFSRGPWFGALIVYLSFSALGPHALSKMFKALGGIILVGSALFTTPFGDRIVHVLPFMGGTVDLDSYLYRQQLLASSLEVIKEHPFFGDRFVYRDLESMRQGQGIIDFVNTYAEIALSYGLVGLGLFLGFILSGTLKAYARARAAARKASNDDLCILGVSLVACVVGTLVMIASNSFVGTSVTITYILMGLVAAYSSMCDMDRTSLVRDCDLADPPTRLHGQNNSQTH
jgi:O-antigen ligase